MKKILVIFIAFSVTLYSCVFDIIFEKDKYRVYVPVSVTNLKDTLNIGDTLIFSTSINNPVEVTDMSRERKRTSNTTFATNAKLELIPSLYGPLTANAVYPNFIKADAIDSTYDFFSNAGIIRILPFPVIKFDYAGNKFVLNFGIIVKKRGLYGVYFQKEYINIKDGGQPFSGNLYPYFKNSNLNHHLVTGDQKSFLNGDNTILFYVR